MTEEQRQQFIEDARVELIRSHVYRRTDTVWPKEKWVIFGSDTPGEILRDFEKFNPAVVLVHMGSTDRTL